MSSVFQNGAFKSVHFSNGGASAVGTASFLFDPATDTLSLPNLILSGSINGVTISATTGTVNLVFSNSPVLVTPALGVATATSVNKVTITAPATSATLTIANGKTITANNTVTLAATDGSTVSFGAGGTFSTASYQPILDVSLGHSPNSSFTNATATNTLAGNSQRPIVKVDLTKYTQARLLVAMNTVANATALMSLRYKTTFSIVATDYAIMGSSEITTALTPASTLQDSGWINLLPGAQADVFLAAVQIGTSDGSGATISSIHAQFR